MVTKTSMSTKGKWGSYFSFAWMKQITLSWQEENEDSITFEHAVILCILDQYPQHTDAITSMLENVGTRASDAQIQV